MCKLNSSKLHMVSANLVVGDSILLTTGARASGKHADNRNAEHIRSEESDPMSYFCMNE